MAPKFKQPMTSPKRGAGGKFKPINYNTTVRRIKRKPK